MLHSVPFSFSQADRANVLIGQAVELCTHGHPVAAAMLSRAALELHVRTLPDANCHRRWHVCLWRLLRARSISPPTFHWLAKLFEIGSCAAHGRPVTIAKIEHLLHGTREFITSTERRAVA